jgi:hypothetical protein
MIRRDSEPLASWWLTPLTPNLMNVLQRALDNYRPQCRRNIQRERNVSKDGERFDFAETEQNDPIRSCAASHSVILTGLVAFVYRIC